MSFFLSFVLSDPSTETITQISYKANHGQLRTSTERGRQKIPLQSSSKSCEWDFTKMHFTDCKPYYRYGSYWLWYWEGGEAENWVGRRLSFNITANSQLVTLFSLVLEIKIFFSNIAYWMHAYWIKCFSGSYIKIYNFWCRRPKCKNSPNSNSIIQWELSTGNKCQLSEHQKMISHGLLISL